MLRRPRTPRTWRGKTAPGTLDRTDRPQSIAPQRVGYYGTFLGEAISETYETETETLAAWMQEPGPRAVIMDPKATQMGFAWHQENGGKIWWTLEMGVRRVTATLSKTKKAPGNIRGLFRISENFCALGGLHRLRFGQNRIQLDRVRVGPQLRANCSIPQGARDQRQGLQVVDARPLPAQTAQRRYRPAADPPSRNQSAFPT